MKLNNDLERIANALDCEQPGCTCIKRTADGGFKTHCPAHSDQKPSLHISEQGGKLLVYCFGGCSQEAVIGKLKGLNLWPSQNGDEPNPPQDKAEVVKTYNYQDPQGNLVFQVCRMKPKGFRQRRPDGNGGWIWNLNGVARLLYHLPEVLKAEIVGVCEGEKDCDVLIALGYTATTNPGGAGKWRPEYNQYFKDKTVFIFPDNDPPGKDHAQDVARNLHGVAASVKVVELPGLPEKGDISDWLAAGGTVEKLAALIEAVPEQTQEKPKTEGQKQIEELICDVSTFNSIEFPEKRYIIEPWLIESNVNMIYGSRGVGKTMFSLGILVAATTGEPFGPWQVRTPVTCLYLDGEMAPQDTQNRLMRFPSLKNLNRKPLIIYCDAYMNQYGLPRANLLDDDWRERMKQLLIANDVKLWVADNIASLAPGIDENSKQDWDPINQWFLELRFAGINTIFLHHTNKDGGQRGTSGREDNIDISILLEKPKSYAPEDGARFIVSFQKSRIEQKFLPQITDMEFALETDKEDNYFWTFASVKKQHKVEVIKMLDEGMIAKTVAEELGLSPGYVSQIKTGAVKDGLLTKEGKLTQSGFAWLSKN